MPAANRLCVLAAQLPPCRERYEALHARGAAAAAGTKEPPPHTPVPKFAVGSDAAREYLAEHGFVVCSDALAPAECAEVLDGMWAFLEGLGTGISRAAPSTWRDEAWPDQSGVGLVCNAGVTHCDWAWRVRAHPQVIAAWASVLGLTGAELITSLDCLSMFRPWGVAEAEPSWRTRGAWWHSDQTVDVQVNEAGQDVGGTDREYIQGFVTMVDTSEESGGFAVVDGSHLT